MRGQLVTDQLDWKPGDPVQPEQPDGDRCSDPACGCTWSEQGPKRCPVCDAPAASEPPETPRETVMRKAYAYLAESIRDKRNVTELGNRLHVCMMALEHGPQVIEFYKAGLCVRCGRHRPEDGYSTCEQCNIRAVLQPW
jgi:hypothetical protein